MLLFLLITPNPVTSQSQDYLVPIVGNSIVTNGPGEGYYHNSGSSSAEAIDFAVKEGTPVYPAKPGVVIYAVNGYNDGYGNLIKIKHDNGEISYYAHLSKIFVSKDQSVTYSTIIGEVGNSGCNQYIPPCGYHLHFEVRSTTNTAVNVRYLVNWNPGCPPCSGYSGTAYGSPREQYGTELSCPLLIHGTYNFPKMIDKSFSLGSGAHLFYDAPGGGRYGNDQASCELNQDCTQLRAINKDSADPNPKGVIGPWVDSLTGTSTAQWKQFTVQCSLAK